MFHLIAGKWCDTVSLGCRPNCCGGFLEFFSRCLRSGAVMKQHSGRWLLAIRRLCATLLFLARLTCISHFAFIFATSAIRCLFVVLVPATFRTTEACGNKRFQIVTVNALIIALGVCDKSAVLLHCFPFRAIFALVARKFPITVRICSS